MRIVQQFIADDGAEFDTEAECLAHEKMLPFAALLKNVWETCKESADFSNAIEEMGAKIARERRAAGNLKRVRRPSETPAPAAPEPPTPEAPFEAPSSETAVDVGDLEPEGCFKEPIAPVEMLEIDA